MQIACSESTVRHALVALAAWHESFQSDSPSKQESSQQFALRQYNLAIRQYLQHIETQGLHEPVCLERSLVPCLIFICIQVRSPDSARY
jgi:hypothetical protein